MLVYRISRRAFAADLTGTGARLFGGRWNSVGVSMIYTASSRALAILEVLVHTTHQYVPDDLEIITIEIPENVSQEEISYQKIAADIKEYGIDSRFNFLGDRWIMAKSSLLLTVPSVVVPEEKNILINPTHQEIKKVKIAEKKPFAFDKRLLLK